MASGSMHSLSMIAEATRGTTPATPTMEILRNTGFTGGLSMSGAVSSELRDGRHHTAYRCGPKKLAFGFPMELSYGSFDNCLEATLMGSWNTNVLKAGTTRRYHTVERKFGDISTGNRYHRYEGSEFDEWSQTLSGGDNGAFVKGEFKCIAYDIDLDDAIITGETYSAVSTTQPFDSFICTLSEGGSGTAIVTELNWTLKNGLEPQYVVGSQLAALPDVGFSDITGSMTVQFGAAGETLFEKFVNQTETSLQAVLTDAAGNSLTIKFGSVRYTGGTIDVSGPGTIPLVLPWQALYNTGDASNIVITRTPDT